MKFFHRTNQKENIQKIELAGDDQPIIRMQSVVKKFKTDAGVFTALNGVNINFYHGDFVGITGKSGSGKSTMANMITGIDHPTSGVVNINGMDVHDLNESQMARWRGKNLGIVFQFYQLLPMLTLLENVMLPMDFGEMYDPLQREERAMELLGMVGLKEYAHKMPAAISGGQQQTAAIARALANDPPIIIADEPTGNLDSRTASHVFKIFEQLAEQGKTIIMVTHDPSLAKLTTRQVVISDGEIINEWVVKALPQLTHTQMLKATHHVTRRVYEPGAVIIRQDVRCDELHIISKGQVDVMLGGNNGSAKKITSLGAGDYFGEVELLEQRNAIATVRAGQQGPVETFTLKADILTEILSDSNTMRDSLMQMVQKRISENLAASKQLLHKKANRGKVAQTTLA